MNATTHTRVRHSSAPAYFLGRPSAVYIDRYLLRGRHVLLRR